ncbi:hypothetical protein [Membranihabitans maritimus]|uniref:hypothetical protein n=1 Tax=Membranihabitans maritimus TaxID=2904244 RepID=UPI001F490F07|nr:hypothetical protein [Membranihabitans maritimus]
MSIKRRSFVKSGVISMTGLSIMPMSNFDWTRSSPPQNFSQFISTLIPINDQTVRQILKRKINNPSSPWHGGYFNQYQIPNAHSTNSFVVRGCISYLSEFSQYYKSKSLKADLESAMDCLLNVQYEDGTIDLYSTNFHSTPDTAFIVNDLIPTFKMMKSMGYEESNTLLEKMKTFILRAGQCFITGGIHTANHRWVVSAALARVYSIDPQKKYIKRIDEWLAEGIDQDSDGQYHERSVSIYSPICNNMFLTIGKLLNRKEFFDIVRKNLEMTLFYIQPGGEVLTEASDRQDKATIAYVNRYYLSYRYFAISDKNGQFSSVCKLIEDKMINSVVGTIPYMYEFSEYQHPLPPSKPLPTRYFKNFSHSGVIRIKEDHWDLSIIENNPTFMVLMKGNVVVQSVRLAAAFFGSKGQFIPEELMVENKKITLKKSITHGYYQPIPEDRVSGKNGWVEYPRDKRGMSELQTMNYTVVISIEDSKVKLDIDVSGTDNVPVSCEMNFRSGDIISGIKDDLHEEQSYFIDEGYAEITNNGDTLKFGPGKMEHQWAQMRGMLPKQNGESVYITGVTPFKHTLYFS